MNIATRVRLFAPALVLVTATLVGVIIYWGYTDLIAAQRTQSLESRAIADGLSRDADQRWLFIPDGTNNVVWILERASLVVVDHFGRLGTNAGQFYRLHDLAIDSRGNLYTTEVNAGRRVQKFDRIE